MIKLLFRFLTLGIMGGGMLFAQIPTITGISVSSSHLQIRFDRPIGMEAFKNFQLQDSGFRDVYDLRARLGTSLPKNLYLQNKVRIRVAQNEPQRVRIVFNSPQKIATNLRIRAKEAVISLEGAPAPKINIASLFEGVDQTKENPTPPPPAPKASKPKKQPPRSLGAGKRIVLDAGHGGKDCGALGASKVCEKEVVLNVAKHLSQKLTARGYKVFMTRTKDVFVNLRDRTKFANDKEADLFISIHANAVPKEKAAKMQGIETYFLSSARSERAKNVAALENKDDIETLNYFSKQSFLNAINSQRMLASNRLAIDVQFGMLNALKGKFEGVVDGGVREGPFWVLAGALMPSVLLELGYITHPLEGKRLTQSAYQKQLAQGIADGIDGYFEKNL